MEGEAFMEMHEELDRETHEMLLQTLAERTLAIPGLTLVKLGKKLMDEKRMADFYRMILDMEYRKKLLAEAGQAKTGQAGGGF